MDNLPIIDPHFHLWDLENNYYPWLSDGVKPSAFGDYSAINKTYLIDDFLADARNQNLVKAVHLDVGYDPKYPAGETRWLQGVADTRGFPHGIVGYADLRKPDVGDLLDEHMQHANFRGIRQSMNFHKDPAKTYLTEPEVSRTPEWRRGFRELARRGLSFDLQLYYWQMEEFLELAGDFPEVQIILNHTGMQVDGPERFDGWRKAMKTLAQAPNVACKISGLGMGDWTWTTESIRPYVEEAIAAFGVRRCMFASNFPVDKLFSTYDAIWNSFTEITSAYSESERMALFHDNAASFYKL
ncbi:putative TIM-barrel fold metal-dependent hydrolase [Sinorhizobium kostiense]|uniref:TIM-barrel fold metal-dependent hydrolase n=1 Tax=Sinorhizobium kostiense TaxID=76747 RepID=A0ABS4R2J2_9HYPH|nr:amidohydrolase [Sinorhizobium kostiense]MBP2237099.1 putative TIM-barrel fold metal-dependent hydrolase [Sinorhizobium kostiense]